MTLSGDQKALLNLLIVRGKSPDEVAGILGVDREVIDTRVEAALAAAAPGGPPIPPAVALQLVGHADPISRADAASTLAGDPDLAQYVEHLEDSLNSHFPDRNEGAPTERLPGSKSEWRTPRAEGARSGRFRTAEVREPDTSRATAGVDSAASGYHMIRNRKLLSALLSASGLLVVAVAAVFLLGDRSEEEPDSGDDQANAITAELAPVGEVKGSGRVELGRVGDNVALKVRISEIEGTRSDQVFPLWLDGGAGPQLAQVVRLQNGAVDTTLPLDPLLLCGVVAGQLRELKLSQAKVAALRGAARLADQERRSGFRRIVGKVLLTGVVSIPPDIRSQLASDCQQLTGQADNQGS